MPRMVPELLLQPSYLNCLNDRELDLRGCKIPAIENLGVTKDSLDTIDLTDNAIRSLSNLPRLPRLKHLLLANNPVSGISPSLPTSLPNLTSLILTGCVLDFLSPTVPLLGQLRRLEFLSLAGSPMSKRKWCREWIIHHCKRLRVLDSTRVTMAERAKAQQLFVDPATKAQSSLAKTLSKPDPSAQSTEAATFVPGEVAPSQAGQAGAAKLTAEERERVRKAIEQADSVDEVRRLQRMLEQGFIPTEKAPPPPVAEPGPAKVTAKEKTVEASNTADVAMEEAAAVPAPVETTTTKAGKTKTARGAKSGTTRAKATRARGGTRASTTRAAKKKDADVPMEMEQDSE